jgi:flagellar protein FlgJ
MINTSATDFSQIQSSMRSQQSYTDLNSLQDIKLTGKEDKTLALRQISQQFESLFIDMMLKSMRSANEVFGQDNPLNTSETKHHQDMYDKQLGLSLSQANNIGLADAFYRQMERNYLGQTNTSDTDKKIKPLASDVMYSPKKAPQKIADASVLNNVNTPQDFIHAVTPYAKKAAQSMGVDYRVLIAQSALETGWGEHVIKDKYGNQSFNLFNIKADSRWDGQSVSVPTIEYVDGVAQREKASFRRYNSIHESFSDYQQFLSQPRYQKALAVSDDAHRFVEELQTAGYATDPKYAAKIQSILNNPQLWSKN